MYVGTNAKDVSGNAIGSYSGQFSLAAAPVPTHVVSSKGSGPSAYSLSTIQVTFNQGVNPSSFTAGDLGLVGPNGSVSITGVAVVPSTNNCTFTITFATQTSPGTYTLYVGTNAKDVSGNAIGSYSGQFSLAAAPVPTHVVSSKGSGPSAYSLSTIQVTFNQGVNPSSFTTGDLGLVGPNGSITITSVAVVSSTNNCTFNITFATQTAPGTYTLYVGTNAKDVSGNAIGSYSGQFSLAAAPVPTHVVSSKGSGPSAYSLSTIQVTFNQGVNPSSFTAGDLGLVGPNGSVSITGVTVVSSTNNCTFNITFATQTAPGTYTLYVGTNAKDVSGNAIGSYSGQFSVAAAPVPTHVVSTTSSGPSANTLSTIQVAFSQGVSPTTFTAGDLGLVGPNGSITITSVTPVAGSGNATFNITFATQTAAGTYTLYIGSNAKDLAGNAISSYQAQFKIAATQTPPPPTKTSVVSTTSSGPSANTLSTIQVTFNQGVSPSSFTASDLGLVGPNGQIAITGVTAVSGTSDRTFNITFATQTAVGTYTLYVGANAKDLSGNAIVASQTLFKIAASTTPAVATFTSSTAVTVPAKGRGVSLLKIGQNVNIAHITVKLNIQYPQDGDLYIHLQAPDGTDITLTQLMGGTVANFPNTTFDDSASKSFAFASGPYTGSYQPLTPLSYLNGKGTQGTWKLWVENSGTGTGTLTGWTLTVTPTTST